jgi:hypothetical protein
MEFLNGAGLTFGRWVRQAPYLPWCGALASSPHRALLAELKPDEQYAAIELFRGTMVRHSVVVYGSSDVARKHTVPFDGDKWLEYVPLRLPNTVVVRDRLPEGASGVLINRDHTFNDLYLPIGARPERLFEQIDGHRRIADMGRAAAEPDLAHEFFKQLWLWDQIVMATGSS